MGKDCFCKKCQKRYTDKQLTITAMPIVDNTPIGGGLSSGITVGTNTPAFGPFNRPGIFPIGREFPSGTTVAGTNTPAFVPINPSENFPQGRVVYGNGSNPSNPNTIQNGGVIFRPIDESTQVDRPIVVSKQGTQEQTNNLLMIRHNPNSPSYFPYYGSTVPENTPITTADNVNRWFPRLP